MRSRRRPSVARVHRKHRRSRGVVYVAVLGIALIVSIIGLSALAAVRLQSQVAASDQDANDAEFYAQAYADVSLLRLTRDPLWRSNNPHDTWLTQESLGDISVQRKFVDDADGNLLDDALDPVRLYTRATVGDAVRLFSVQLQPTDPLSASTLYNPGFESGTTGWSGSGCSIGASSSAMRTGSGCLLVASRSGSWAGPRQNITSSIHNGASYTTEVWVKMASGNANVRVTIEYRTSTLLGLLSSTDYRAMTPWVSVGTQWTRVSGVAWSAWSNSLNSANIYIETQSGTGSFYVDDFQFYRTGHGGTTPIEVVAGTWRVETLD